MDIYGSLAIILSWFFFLHKCITNPEILISIEYTFPTDELRVWLVDWTCFIYLFFDYLEYEWCLWECATELSHEAHSLFIFIINTIWYYLLLLVWIQGSSFYVSRTQGNFSCILALFPPLYKCSFWQFAF